MGCTYADMFIALREIVYDPCMLHSILTNIQVKRMTARRTVCNALHGFQKK